MNAVAQIGSRAGDDERNACGLGGRDSHISGSDVSVASSRHVTAGYVDRDQALACDKPRMQLDREFADRIALRLREAPHAVGSELDVVPHARRDVPGATLDLLVRHDYVAAPPIEFRSIISHGLFAAAPDLGAH